MPGDVISSTATDWLAMAVAGHRHLIARWVGPLGLQEVAGVPAHSDDGLSATGSFTRPVCSLLPLTQQFLPVPTSPSSPSFLSRGVYGVHVYHQRYK